jgi:hypothetical protein
MTTSQLFEVIGMIMLKLRGMGQDIAADHLRDELKKVTKVTTQVTSPTSVNFVLNGDVRNAADTLTPDVIRERLIDEFLEQHKYEITAS